MTSFFGPQYTRLRALHGEVKAATSDIKTTLDSCPTSKDFTALGAKETDLAVALTTLSNKIDDYSECVDKLRSKIDRMAIETPDQQREKKKEIDLFKELMETEDDDLDYDQVFLQGPFLDRIRTRISNVLSNTLTSIHNRLQFEKVSTSSSTAITHAPSTSITIPTQVSPTTDNQSIHSIQNELVSTALSKMLENSSLAPLPPITLTTFNGETTQWETFYSQYTSMIEPRSISNHEKLVYLRNALKGAAFRTVEGIPVANDRLQETIDRLKDVYGESNRTNSILVSQLMSIRPKSQSLEDQFECTQRIINKVYQVNDKSVVDNYTLIHQIASSIHSKHLEKMFKQQPTTMMQALRIIETDLLERIQISNLKSTFRSPSSPDSPPNVNHRDFNPVKDKTKFHPTKNGPSSTNPPCIYCGEHPFSDCPTVSSITDRRAILKEKKLCFKCLSSKHLFNQCDRKCPNCSKPHHKSLCDSTSNTQKPTHYGTHTVTSSQPVFGVPRLYTTPATIQNPLTNRQTVNHVLLDSGAMLD